MKDNKTQSITIRVTKELKDTLQIMADKDRRTLSNMLEVILEDAVKNQGKKK